MTKRMLLVILILVVVLGGTLGFDFYKSRLMAKFAKNFRPPPQVVSTITVKAETWHPSIEAVGSLKAIQGIDINPEVPGQVMAIHFKSGEKVRKGQSLIQLDDSVDQAQLRNDLASLALAKVDFKRQSELLRTGATSKQALDQARAKLGETEADVAGDRVKIDKKNIKAPFSGVLGIRKVNVGEYVTAGQALVALQQMDPLYVDFNLPEQDLKSVFANQPVEARIGAFPNHIFKGHLKAVNSTVDINTRTFMVRAEIPNENNKLYPGVFANVSVILPAKNKVITIPQTAISYTLYGDSAYVVAPKGKDKSGKSIFYATRQPIKLGERRGDVVAVLSGLQAGEQVINAGQVKLQGNSQVIINNSIQLKD